MSPPQEQEFGIHLWAEVSCGSSGVQHHTPREVGVASFTCALGNRHHTLVLAVDPAVAHGTAPVPLAYDLGTAGEQFQKITHS